MARRSSEHRRRTAGGQAVGARAEARAERAQGVIAERLPQHDRVAAPQARSRATSRGSARAPRAGRAAPGSRRPRAARGTRRTSAGSARRGGSRASARRRRPARSLRVAGAQHVEREPLVLRVRHGAERHALPRAARDRSRSRSRRTWRARAPGSAHAAPRATRRAMAANQSSNSRAHHRARVRAGPVRAADEPDVLAARTRRAAAPASARRAGSASWVRNATCSPRASSISRLRVPPCENASGAIALHARARSLGQSRGRPVRRAGVDHDDLDAAGRPAGRERAASTASR